MPLPDVHASRAVLIGAAGYRHLEPLPAVPDHLDILADLLRDPEVWGLPWANCTVVRDPHTPAELLEPIWQAAREATDTLLVYYAGHGLVDSESDLLLAVAESDDERMFRSARYADVRRELRGADCRRKALILDCSIMPELDEIDGAWLLTGTDFTGELITVLRHGIPEGPELLDTDAIYLRVLHGLRAKEWPEPRQRGRVIDLVRNRAAPTATATPEIDDGPYLRLPPAALAAQVAALRDEGRTDAAVAVLAGSGRARSEQEVASIMATLAASGRAHDVAAVAFAAAGRDPHELHRIYQVLLEIGQPRLAIGLLKVVATGLPERTARFVAVLDEPDAVPVLLRAAVTDCEGRPQRLVDLLNALRLAHRRPEVQLLLAEAQRVLPPGDLAVVADALRDAGRDTQAFRLYGRAIPALVRREPAPIAAIVTGLPRGDDRRLAEQAIAVRMGAPGELADLIVAFEAAGLDQIANAALTTLGARLPEHLLGEVTRELRERGCETAALRLHLAAAADRPIDDILRLSESLNEQGRPMDALNLLAHAAQVRPVADLVRMTDDGSHRRVFAAVAGQGDVRRAAAFYRALAEHPDGRIEQLRAELLRRPAEELVAVVAALLDADAPRLADGLLHAAVRSADGTPQHLAAAAVDGRHVRAVLHLAAVTTPEELPWIFREVLRALPEPGDAERWIAPLLAELPRPAITSVVSWIRDLDPAGRGPLLLTALAALPVDDLVTVAAALAATESADELLGRVAGDPITRVAALIGELRRRGERAPLRTVVDAFRDLRPTGTEVFKLASWLCALTEKDLALLAVRDRLWITENHLDDTLAIAVADHLHLHARETDRLDVAFPALIDTNDPAELAKAYGLADGELGLLVLCATRARKLTPVLFTERGVHHTGGGRYAYRDLRELRIALGRRNAVELGAGPESWPMPTAAAAQELVELLTEIQALARELAEPAREATHVRPEPVPHGIAETYELDGEAS